jgi:SH3-like domain-containing protein
MKEVAVGRFRYSVPAAVAFALLIVGVSSTSTFAQTAGNGAQVTVTGTSGSGVNFRVTPGGAAIASFPDGTKLTVVGQDQQATGRTWRNVRSPDGVVGWVAADYLSGTAQAPGSSTTQAANRPGAATGTALQIVKTGGMNGVIRDNPGGTQVGSYPEGTSMTLVSSDAREAGGREWKNVKGPDGKSGWMASFLLNDSSGGVTVAAPSNPTTARSPFTLTADMRARALAARARAVPLTSTPSDTKKDDKKTSSSNKP